MILFADSFESTDDEFDFFAKYFDVFGATLVEGTGRFGGRAASFSGSGYLERDVASASTMIAGGVFKPSNGKRSILHFKEGGTVHIDIELQESMGIAIRRGATEIAHMDISGLTHGTHHFIEVKVVIHDSTGSVEILVDGQGETFSGLDTKNGGTGVISRIKWATNQNGGIWSQFHVLDTAGSAPQNDFLGDHRIDLLMPTSDGNYTEFGTTFPASPTSHWDKVEETEPDADSSYNEGTGANERDTFGMENLTALTSQTILAVQIFSHGKYITGATNLRNKLRISGTDYDQGSQAMNSAYKYIFDVLGEDPDAGPGAWVESVINGLESGYEEL